MTFPKSLDILLDSDLVRNSTKSGEVTDSVYCPDLKFMDLLSQELGFSYTVYSTEFRQYGDIYAGSLVLEERMYVWSTYPHYIEDTSFAVGKPGYVSNSGGFLRPFAMPLWMVFILSVVLMAFAKFLIFQGKVSFSTVLFYASVTLLGQNRSWKPKSRAQKLVVLSWSLGITFLTLAYTAVLLSFLTVPGREKGITDLDDLYEAIKKGRATALKFEADTTDDMLIYSGLEKFKLIGEQIQKENTLSIDKYGNFLEVIKPNVAVFGTRSALEAYYGGEDHFISKDFAFMFMRVLYDWTENGFCCMDELNAAIYRIWSTGLFKKNHEDHSFKWMLYLRSNFPDTYSRDENTISPLNLSDMSGAFYLLLMGHILWLLCLICEIVIHRCHCKFQVIPESIRKIERKLD